MAGTQQKRQREESREEEEEAEASRVEFSKRENSYNNILSILDDEQEYYPSQDLSAILTTLQQELSCSSTTSTTTSTAATFDFDYLPATTEEEAELEFDYQQDLAAGGGSGGVKKDEEEEDDGVRVMKHLLEASDDELGIPNRVDEGITSGKNPPPPFAFSDGLGELEDETANHYTILQSEFFM
ncbi:Hypothetical predicted protein [Olea europaea subsp. europaea]|uniref:Uncharacterized protein n=1 Tax=Olea europaea subsp. europaea TaxID=158383 RepID=A0A8S0PJM9_OLEEU|nr:Hypothetical predicted protein [Olea europaea subsp. europaea]